MTEPEVCSKCGQPKAIKLVLRNEKTGEDTPLCQVCATRWLLSDEEWPPKKQISNKTSILRTNEITC